MRIPLEDLLEKFIKLGIQLFREIVIGCTAEIIAMCAWFLFKF